jgi:hypothetical protein
VADQGGLADSRWSFDQRQARLARSGLLEHATKASEQRLAADERRPPTRGR